MRALGIALVMLVATSTTLAQDAFVLKRVATAGEKHVYTINVEFEFQGVPAKYTAKTTEETAEIAPDGGYKVRSRQSEAFVEFGDQKMEQPSDDADSVTVFSPLGHVLDISGTSTGTDEFRVARLSATIWPTAPVEVGASWIAEVPADAARAVPKVTYTYKLVGTDSVAGREAVKIEVSAKEGEGDLPASFVGTTWLDKATGLSLRVDGAYANAPMAGQLLDAKVRVEIVS